MPLTNLLIGLAMLLFGRRLFWLFVAGAGFAIGALLALRFLEDQTGWVILAIALVVGLLAALLAIFAQKLAIGLGGFLAGAYLGYTLAMSLHAEDLAWIAFPVGGILGAVLLVALFDWALIVLSSLTGAAVAVQGLPWQPPWPAMAFLGLLILGLVVQTRQFRRSTTKKPD